MREQMRTRMKGGEMSRGEEDCGKRGMKMGEDELNLGKDEEKIGIEG